MKLPLPTNKLVALSLVGGLLAAGASIALALPGILPAAAPEGAPAAASAPASFADAPRGEHEDDEHEAEAYLHWLDEIDER